MPYEFNLKNLFQDFNPSKFLVYLSLLIFSILFSLRLEGSIECSFYVVFIPLWIWKVAVIVACSLGCYVWLAKPYYRTERDSHIQFRGMIISSSLQMLLFMFELMAADKLNNNRPQVFWLFAFIPLFSISIASTGLCVWSMRHGRSFELELLCAVNILQFIFLALKLDNFIHWRWVVIFIPAWLVLCISLIYLMYAIILSLVLIRSSEISADLKRRNIITATGYTCVFLPLLVFIIFLSNKLDNSMQLQYPLVFAPLFVSITACLLLTFNSRATNNWWFGARKDFCTFMLDTFPSLQVYANTSYKMPHKRKSNNSTTTTTTTGGGGGTTNVRTGHTNGGADNNHDNNNNNVHGSNNRNLNSNSSGSGSVSNNVLVDVAGNNSGVHSCSSSSSNVRNNNNNNNDNNRNNNKGNNSGIMVAGGLHRVSVLPDGSPRHFYSPSECLDMPD